MPGGVPDRAIMRTEFDTVYIQEPVCNGCRDCMTACPFGVIHMSGTENTGKGTAKKDLALMAMQYGHVYVARVAFGAKDSQTVSAFREAEFTADEVGRHLEAVRFIGLTHQAPKREELARA